MQKAVQNGLEAEGILPGGLGIRRKASDYLIRAKGYGSSIKSRGMVYAFALAVSEENACGGKIVTAPTCGSCGVMPAVLYHLKDTREFRDSRILPFLESSYLSLLHKRKHNISESQYTQKSQGIKHPWHSYYRIISNISLILSKSFKANFKTLILYGIYFL